MKSKKGKGEAFGKGRVLNLNTMSKLFLTLKTKRIMNRIKLVVLNENIFGYIFPEQLNRVQILHASILKGAISQDGSSTYIKPTVRIRPVNKSDFDSFNIYFPQYLSDAYSWDKPTENNF